MSPKEILRSVKIIYYFMLISPAVLLFFFISFSRGKNNQGQSYFSLIYWSSSYCDNSNSFCRKLVY